MIRRPAAALAFLFAAVAAAGCDDDCCTVVDSYPIPLLRAPMGGPFGGDGALYATAARPGAAPGETFPMLVATGSPITALAGDPGPTLATQKGGFDLIGPGADPTTPAKRAMFRGLSMLRLPLGAVGGDATTLAVGGVIGGNLLRAYSIELRFAPLVCAGSATSCPSMTLWGHLGTDLGFLQDAGYAVIRFTPYGGGETTAQGDADFLGERGPLVLPPTRAVLRGCALPDLFTPDMPPKTCCTATDAMQLGKGVDLSLMVDTGIGPLVLSQAAWKRVVAAAAMAEPPAVLPEPIDGTLSIATWNEPIPVGWSTIPRYALVDLEVGAMNDPGPCVELGRSRRTEQVSYQIVANMSQDECAQPCDTDRGTGLPHTSAAYLEISGNVPVAVVADAHLFLQSLRFDIRPEGPELDGIVGVAALGRSRVEIDYRSSPVRAIFSCEAGAPRGECWAGARCPRLPNQGDVHFCFGLGPHTLAPSCAASRC
jgi:hypothetical protein